MKQPAILFFGFVINFLFFELGCNKKFDSPPAYGGPDIQPNLSIMELRKMHFPGNFEKILDDLFIEGIIVADDRKDNFYKTIVLQDSTAGITIRMDGTGLFTNYPVGRRITVRLKNMWMGEYAKMLQLGSGVDRSNPAYPEIIPIPTPLFELFLVKKEFNNTLIPKQVRIDELTDSLQSCLIKIDNVEFSVGDTGKTYADAINKVSDNTIVKACSGGSIYLRTSGFANFASAKTPRGNGSIIAIFSVFNSEKQLLLRDTSDIQMKGLRCTGTGAKVLFNEDFEKTSLNGDLFISGWKNVSESGNKLFQSKLANNNRYAEITGFATALTSINSWLILPPIDLSNSSNEVFSFQTKDGFDNGAILQVFASSNYDGGNTPWKAKWTLLKAQISKGSVTTIANNWVSSGNISLTGFSGKVYIGFRYDAADPPLLVDKRTTTFQLDNVKIMGN